MAKILDNKYTLGDIVYYGGVPHWITGIRAAIGYDSVNWEYQITKPTYFAATADGFNAIGGSFDVDCRTVKEHDITTPQQAVEAKRKELEAKQAELREAMENVDRELRR